MNDFEQEAEELEQELQGFKNQYQKLKEKMDTLESSKQSIEKKVDIQASNIDFKALEEFVKDEYWLVNQIDDNEYEIWIPNFMDVQAGVLDRQSGGYNVFILDQTTKLISGIPDFLQEQVDLETETKFKVKEDLLEFEEGQRDVVEDELDEYVEDVKDDKATIKQDKGHALVRDLLDRGEMPFTPAPVEPVNLRESETLHTLRPYQQDAIEEWMQHGAITVCFMTGAGKTHVGIEALDRLKYDAREMRKAVVCYSKITAKQWKNKIEEFAPRLEPVIMSGTNTREVKDREDVVEIYTYQGMDKLEALINERKEYGIIAFDESDFLPSRTFSIASTFPIKYRMGLTASPVRSEENPNDVFALCGKPVGMDWKDTLEQMEQEMFPVNIHVVKQQSDKLDRAKEVRDGKKTTLFFVESIDFGEKLSEHLNLEFIHGKHNKQKQKIENAIEEDNACIVSRIANRGMSIESVERLVEVDNRGDSRREIIQRIGRLFHGQGEQADIIYTAGEANKFQERFYALIEKGFEINDVDNALEMPQLGEGTARDIDPKSFQTEEPDPITHAGGSEPDQKSRTRPSRTEYEDPIEMLKNSQIQELIEDLIEEIDSPYSEEKKKEALLAIAKKNGELTHKDVEEVIGIPTGQSGGAKLTKPFRLGSPSIMEKDSEGCLVLKVDKMNEILSDWKEKQETREDIEELKGELGL